MYKGAAQNGCKVCMRSSIWLREGMGECVDGAMWVGFAIGCWECFMRLCDKCCVRWGWCEGLWVREGMNGCLKSTVQVKRGCGRCMDGRNLTQ